MTLAVGGNFVTKQYTFFTPFSQSLIAIVAAVFEEVFVTKPLTSRPSNSEVYLIGRRFLGISPLLRAALLQKLAFYREQHQAYKKLPSDFGGLVSLATLSIIEQSLLSAAHQIHGQQVKFVKEAIELYSITKNNLRQLGTQLLPLAQRQQQAWLADYAPGRIRPDQALRCTPGYGGPRMGASFKPVDQGYSKVADMSSSKVEDSDVSKAMESSGTVCLLGATECHSAVQPVVAVAVAGEAGEPDVLAGHIEAGGQNSTMDSGDVSSTLPGTDSTKKVTCNAGGDWD